MDQKNGDVDLVEAAPEDLRARVAKVVSVVLETRKWSAARFAREIGVAPSTVTRILDPNSKFVPSSRTVSKITAYTTQRLIETSDRIYEMRDQMAVSVASQQWVPMLGVIKPGAWVDPNVQFRKDILARIRLHDADLSKGPVVAFQIEEDGVDPEFIGGTTLFATTPPFGLSYVGDIVVVRRRVDAMTTDLFELTLWDVVEDDKGKSLSPRGPTTWEGPSVSGRLRSDRFEVIALVLASYRRRPRAYERPADLADI